MKIIIEIPDEVAAAVWANFTYCGKNSPEATIEGIIADRCATEAADYAAAFPEKMEAAKLKFAQRFPTRA